MNNELEQSTSESVLESEIGGVEKKSDGPVSVGRSVKYKLTRDVLLLAIFSTLLFSVAVFSGGEAKKGVASVNQATEREEVVIKENPFDTFAKEAKSIYVYDVNKDRALFSLNENESLPLASLTKVMTAFTALSLVPDNTVIRIAKEDLLADGDSGLYLDEKWILKKLADFVLLTSSNDGARSIASGVGSTLSNLNNYDQDVVEFVKKMNFFAKKIGLENTYYLNETGLDEDGNLAGAYGTSKDMANLMAYVLKTKPEVVSGTNESQHSFISIDNLRHDVENTNISVDKIPRILASKTGYTELAGGNLLVAIDAGINRPVVIAVLGSTPEGRFKDVERLAWATLEYISNEENFILR